MPTFGNQVQTTAGPALPSDILIGDGHVTRDAEFKGPLTLVVGDVVGFEQATGRMTQLDTTEANVSLSGDGTTTTFDLDHDSVDTQSLAAYGSDGKRLANSVTRGTGTDGVDQINFDVAPASGTVTARYRRTTAIPAGVAIGNAQLEANEVATLPVVLEGTVSFDHVQGLPAEAARYSQFNALRFA